MIQPNAPDGLGGFSAWPAQARAFPALAAFNNKSLFVQPNARYGSRALFRLGAPSQGILFLRTVAGIRENRSAAARARRMPQWLGWILRL